MTGPLTHRRFFVTLLGGAAAAWPLAARAQQDGRMRRIAILMAGSENDPEARDNLAALREGLIKLGWTEGRNLRVELRFGAGDFNRLRRHAAEVIKQKPEVIFAQSVAATRAAQEQTQTIPIVFVGSGDNPVGVQNIARPEGNITGFPDRFSSMSGKWVELLKEVAPRVIRIAVLFNPQNAAAGGPPGIPIIAAAARVLGVTAITTQFRTADDLESLIEAFAGEPNGGLIVMPNASTATRDIRQSIMHLATRHRLPAIHWNRLYPAEGGLMSYGSDFIDLHRRAAGYVDRLLRGAKVSELPVQFPTKFELVVNLKTAKAIGLAIPEAFLLRADEVIE